MSRAFRDPLDSQVSRPATDFAPAARAEPSLPAIGFDPPRSGILDVVCSRPLLHVLEFERLRDLTAAVKERAPGLEVRLLLCSDLADDGPFRLLAVDRIARLPRTFEPRDLKGRLGAAWVLLGEDAKLEAELRQEAAGWLATEPLGFRAPWSEHATAPAHAFQIATRAESPRWIRARGAPVEVRLPVAPRVLVHQARFHIGDALWLTPLLRALRRRFSGARVTVVGPPATRKIFARTSGALEVLPWSEAGGVPERRRILDHVAGEGFDAALFAFARRPESHWLARQAQEAGVPTRVNLEYFDAALDPERIAPWATHEGWFFWNAIASPEMLLHALDPFDDSVARLADRRVEFRIGSGSRDRAQALLAARGLDRGSHLITIAPGGRSSARWPASSYAALAAALAESGAGVLLEGAPSEGELLASVAEGARALTTSKAQRRRIVAASDPFEAFAAILERSTLLVANDSAPIHFAEAVGTPTLYFAERQKLVHSHPAGSRAWALFDPRHNDVRSITVEQALGAARAISGGSDLPAERTRG